MLTIKQKWAFAVSLLVAALIGFGIAGLIVFNNVRTYCADQPVPQCSVPSPALQAKVQALKSFAPSLTQGTIVSTTADAYVLDANVIDPSGGSATTTEVTVPFDSAKDKVLQEVPDPTSTSSPTKVIAATFSDIKAGDSVTLQVIDGVKTTYILAQ